MPVRYAAYSAGLAVAVLALAAYAGAGLGATDERIGAAPKRTAAAAQSALITLAESGITAMNVNGTGRTAIVPYTSLPGLHAFSWSPDGRRLAYVATADSAAGSATTALYVSNPDGTQPRRIAVGYIVREEPAWSPDGARLAFNRYAGDRPSYIVNADGSGERRLGPAIGWVEAWLRDGRLLVAGGRLIDIESGRETRLAITQGRFADEHMFLGGFGWSPDGGRVAFGAVRKPEPGKAAPVPETAVALYTANMDGTDIKRLAQGFNPVWSPDGAQILFERTRPDPNGDRTKVFLVGVSGGPPIMVAAGRNPEWRRCTTTEDCALPSPCAVPGGVPPGIFVQSEWRVPLPPRRYRTRIARAPGSGTNDLVCASGAREWLQGLGGRDILLGGGGRDVLEGGKGQDVLFGGADRDVFRTRDGTGDRVDGGPGFDLGWFDRSDQVTDVERRFFRRPPR